MFRLGGVVRKSRHRPFLYNSKSSSSPKVAPRSYVSSCGSQAGAKACRKFKWAPVTVSGDREGANDARIVKTAFGLFGGVFLVALGAQKRLEDPQEPALCDASELQTTSSSDNGSFTFRPESTRFLLSESYRRELFFKYERRIRLRSQPEKVFLYFASVIDLEGQALMTPADLMRAVVPVFPPSVSTRVREGYLRGERKPSEENFDLQCPPSKFFMLFDTDGDGLISFSEYIFLVILLSIPEENFSTAFKMFDLDGSGFINREEFNVVMGRMRERTRQGLAQRSGLRPGLKISNSAENGGLVDLFFGPDSTKTLRHDDFKRFLEGLHQEIIHLEFTHYDTKRQGTIAAQDFALSMIAAADLTTLSEYLRRAADLNKLTRFKNARISEEEFRQFARLRKKLPALALAISIAGDMSKREFKRAAAKVCQCPLSDVVVDIVFHIFDLNQDGNLSSEEFLKVMERREREIAQPQATGLLQLLTCFRNCAQGCRSSLQFH